MGWLFQFLALFFAFEAIGKEATVSDITALDRRCSELLTHHINDVVEGGTVYITSPSTLHHALDRAGQTAAARLLSSNWAEDSREPILKEAFEGMRLADKRKDLFLCVLDPVASWKQDLHSSTRGIYRGVNSHPEYVLEDLRHGPQKMPASLLAKKLGEAGDFGPSIIFVRTGAQQDSTLPLSLFTAAHEGLHHVDSVFFSRWVTAELKLKRRGTQAPNTLFARYSRTVSLEELSQPRFAEEFSTEELEELRAAHLSGDWMPHLVSMELYLAFLESRAYYLMERMAARLGSRGAFTFESDGYRLTHAMTGGHVPLNPEGFFEVGITLKRLMLESITLADSLN